MQTSIAEPSSAPEPKADEDPCQTTLLGTPTNGGANTITVVVLKNDAAAAASTIAVENGDQLDGTKKRDTAVTLNPRSVNDTR